ncbi:MAG TPA: DUF5684 domain-containing protein [Verrucomicrobiae bacterium]|nr:DUF5684 domain-containing protein [Verrucomicrobiae bacterium]
MDNNSASAAAGAVGVVALFFIVLWLGLALLMIVSMWKIFTKAGQPGWAAIIPIYNVYVLLMVAGKPGWWLVLMLIPIVNFIIGILVVVAVCDRFGKGVGFAIGMLFLPMIFYPMLGFGSAQYTPAPAVA